MPQAYTSIQYMYVLSSNNLWEILANSGTQKPQLNRFDLKIGKYLHFFFFSAVIYEVPFLWNTVTPFQLSLQDLIPVPE